MEETRRIRPFETNKQGTYELTEAEAASILPTWVCIRSYKIAYIIYECIYKMRAYSFLFNILWDSWVCERVGLCLLCLLLLLLSCPSVAFSKFDVMPFALYHILFFHVWLLSLRNLSFSNEAERERWRRPGRNRRRGNYNQDILPEKRIYFQETGKINLFSQ